MKVEVVREFNDLKEGVGRKVGEQFVCSKDRFAQINSTEFGAMVRPVPEDKDPEDKAPEE